ncbi:MAG: phosphatase PAP2 family protein [Rhizobiaceae bacterium]
MQAWQEAPIRAGIAMRAYFMAPWRPRLYPGEATWTASMTRMAVAFVAAAAVLTLFDAYATIHVRETRGMLHAVMHAITDVGKSEWYLVPSAIILLVLGALDWRARPPRVRAQLAFLFSQAGYAFAAVAVSGILVNIVKLFFGRGRPVLFEQGGIFQFQPFSTQYANLSFPSGHSTTCGALAMILILWFPRWWPAWSAWFLAIAMSRVPAGAHYPSDVVAGFGFGLLYALWLARWLAVRKAGFTPRPGHLLPALRFARAWRVTT